MCVCEYGSIVHYQCIGITIHSFSSLAAPYPVEIPQQTIDPVLAEELANAPREAAPGSVPGELPYPVELTLDQPPQSSYN